MSSGEDYNYEDPEGFVITNGIIKGLEVPYITDYNNCGEWVLDGMKANPQYVGQVNGLNGSEETFAEMTEKSVKCAMWMLKQNIKPGDVIGICTHNQMDMYIPCFASLYVGAVFNPWWDTGLTEEMAKFFLTLTKPKMLFTNEASATLAIQVAKEVGMEMEVVVFGKVPGVQSLNDILASQDSKLVPEFRCVKLTSFDDPAVIMYTSGSSGLPKGALYSHRCLFENSSVPANVLETNNTTRSMVYSSLAWPGGLYALIKEVSVPETRIIYPEFSEEKCLELIDKFKVNRMILLSSIASKLQRSPAISKYDLSSLNLLWIGGVIIKEENQKAIATSLPNTRVLQGYGCTEMGGVVVQQLDKCKPGSCGRIFKSTMMKVIEPETGRVLGPNQIGEACFKSSSMMTCYYNNPKDTSKVIDPEGWFHTGDLVLYDEEGYVFYVDRMKEMIKYRGHHVSPAMIEQVLQSHPEVLEAAVVAIPHAIDDEHPIAFITKIPNAKVKKEELEKLVANVLPDYMKLRGGIEILEELVHTCTGKVAKARLRNLANSYARE